MKISALQYTGMMLLEEIASIFITPFLLMFVVPKVYFSCIRFSKPIAKLRIYNDCVLTHFEFTFQRVDDILQFIKDFTVDIEGVGHVCR